MVYTNSLSRSSSRSKVRKHCQRKYFFSYYTNFLREKDEILRLEALTVKNLRSINMRLGGVIHTRMSRYLHILYDDNRSKKGNTKENVFSAKLQQLTQDIFNEMDKKYIQSKNKNYSVYDKNNTFGLSEHFYEEDIDDLYQQKKLFVNSVFERFLRSKLHQDITDHIQSDKKLFIESDKPDFENMKFTIHTDQSDLPTIPVMAQPDFGVILSANEYIIYDRKSGKNRYTDNDPISDQLKTYAYKVILKQKLKTFTISAYEVYLQDMSVAGGVIDAKDIQDIHQKILQDVDNMKTKLIDQDIKKNKAISIQVFEKTIDTSKCLKCRFRDICSKTID